MKSQKCYKTYREYVILGLATSDHQLINIISFTYINWFKLLSITFSINQNLSVKVELFLIFDLLFIALISLASGILLAFIFIYLRSMKNSKSIQYDFEEAYDDGFNSSTMPTGLSIENNASQQQLDLAITYFEMNDLDNAKKLLKDLLKSDYAEIQKASKKLLDKFN